MCIPVPHQLSVFGDLISFDNVRGNNRSTRSKAGISATIRKSDYGVRLGGDEFCIILIDYEEAEAKVITDRIQEQLAIIDTENRVSFSWGAYKMRLGDNLEEAMKIADQRLYQHKKQRSRTSSAEHRREHHD
ncbi:diguanylate cyclase domain-containing protein [Kluyvera sichuanensis]|uniref:diguanylate cyclase domain-containing protein n=1 Tax=Kluyvera sichuanensis TaxID=2725494 RepID=UPI0039F5141C